MLVSNANYLAKDLNVCLGIVPDMEKPEIFSDIKSILTSYLVLTYLYNSVVE